MVADSLVAEKRVRMVRVVKLGREIEEIIQVKREVGAATRQRAGQHSRRRVRVRARHFWLGEDDQIVNLGGSKKRAMVSALAG